MMDPVTLMLLGVGMRSAVRIADALARSMVLRARAELVRRATTSSAPGVDLSDQSVARAGRLIRASAAQTPARTRVAGRAARDAQQW